MPIRAKKSSQAFTLLELLIALFIFTILSMMLVKALHTIIQSEAAVEVNAQRMRTLQMTLLIISRDIEQAFNRSVINYLDKTEPPFVGTPINFTLTHAGVATESFGLSRSNLQRTAYRWQDEKILRRTWDILDALPSSKPHDRILLSDVTAVQFEYLDQKGNFQTQWPLGNDTVYPLPRAVKLTMTIKNWGSISQLYVIPAQPVKSVA